MIERQNIVGFDWDDGNRRKSLEKHQVSQPEAESIFFNEPLVVAEDAPHGRTEERFNALGTTLDRRLLHVTFTWRQDGKVIRIISARDMNRKERMIYEKA